MLKKFNIGSGMLDRAKSTFKARASAGGRAAPADSPLRKASSSRRSGLGSRLGSAVGKAIAAKRGEATGGQAKSPSTSKSSGGKGLMAKMRQKVGESALMQKKSKGKA